MGQSPVAKRCYTKRLEDSFSANNPSSVWRKLQDITNYWRPSPHTPENHQLADNLNTYCCRFDSPTSTPIIHPSLDIKQPVTPTATLLPLLTVPPPALRICDRMCVTSSRDRRSGSHQVQTVCPPPVCKSVLTN